MKCPTCGRELDDPDPPDSLKNVIDITERLKEKANKEYRRRVDDIIKHLRKKK